MFEMRDVFQFDIAPYSDEAHDPVAAEAFSSDVKHVSIACPKFEFVRRVGGRGGG
jgi:hypothetical protein